MKKYFYKIITLILIASFISQSVLLIKPQDVRAQWLVEEVGPQLVNGTLQTGLLTTLVAQSTTRELRETVFNGLAWMFAKLIVQQLTTSVVTWINSGFNGSPSFVQNPGAFFLDLADQATGAFISGELEQLCSPFSLDIKIALSFKYHPYVPERYRCTLGTIIQNSVNAVENASINGFTAGDFRQGGWPAFISLSTEPQNSVYGAYLQADSDLSFRAANLEWRKQNELNQGRGFLSWHDCSNVETVVPEGTPGSQTDSFGNTTVSHNDGPMKKDDSNCPVSTPGSVIAGFLDKQLGAPTDQLNLADSINEIVNALFAQLVTQVMSVGLSTVSGSGPSDSGSYINQIRNQINGSSEQVNSIGSKLINQVDIALGKTLEYQANKNSTLNLFVNVKSNYEAVKACYAQKIVSAQSGIQFNAHVRMQEYQSKIAEMDSIITTNINPAAQKLIAGAQEADDRVATLQSIKTAASTAQTLNDLNTPSQQMASMVSENRLTTEKDLADSKKEYEDTKKQVAKFEQDAQKELRQCQFSN